MKVLIAGAGIGGLSAAIAFQNDGHEVYCFDRVREMRPIGAAISGELLGEVRTSQLMVLQVHQIAGNARS